ncbi:tetraspanin [Xylaria bambusicola]|uniref:tetraspanin n=1 Tax=Xylaria bambusicola TaxID=326684 RepID=UPI002007854F|nr:tetraspanin [Xylaria bambusicola]KAI0522267.1 tetraspanin [Xylaria bambusicola]
MVNKVLAAFIGVDIVFAITGAIIVGFSVIVRNTCFDPPIDGHEAARDLLYRQFPLTAGIGNGIFTFVAFIATLPALATNSRTWLKAAVCLIVVDALYTLVIGLQLWILTLRIKETFFGIWKNQTEDVQGFMEEAFNCCGYFNSTSPAFKTNPTCPSPATAALMTGCATPLTRFSNTFVDNIFTALFAIVGVDAVLIVAALCLLKERKEMERYRHIDEKTGARGTF